MVKLISSDDLGSRPIPTGTRSMVTASPLPPVKDNSLAIAAQGIGKVVDFVADQRKTIMKQEFAQADSLMQRAKLESDNSIEDEPDYASWEKTYRTSLTKQRDAIAETISNPAMRQSFMADADLLVTKGGYEVRNKARGREKDAGVSHLDEISAANMETFVLTEDPEEMATVMTATMGLISAANERRHIDDVDAEKRRQQWASGASESWLKNQDAAKRLEILRTEPNPDSGLTGTVVDMLPIEKRVTMLKATEKEAYGDQVKRVNGVIDEMLLDGDYISGFRKITSGKFGDEELDKAFAGLKIEDQAEIKSKALTWMSKRMSYEDTLLERAEKAVDDRLDEFRMKVINPGAPPEERKAAFEHLMASETDPDKRKKYQDLYYGAEGFRPSPDPSYVSNMQLQAERGQLSLDQVEAARKNMPKDDFDKLLTSVRAGQNAAARTAMTQIDRAFQIPDGQIFLTSEMQDKVARVQPLKFDMQEWLDDNPDASPAQIRAKTNALIKENNEDIKKGSLDDATASLGNAFATLGITLDDPSEAQAALDRYIKETQKNMARPEIVDAQGRIRAFVKAGGKISSSKPPAPPALPAAKPEESGSSWYNRFSWMSSGPPKNSAEMPLPAAPTTAPPEAPPPAPAAAAPTTSAPAGGQTSIPAAPQASIAPPPGMPLLRQDLYPGEVDYFRRNPKTTGMMTPDDRIILNPFSTLNEDQRKAVYENERARLYMKKNEAPLFQLTAEQEAALDATEYKDATPEQRRSTIAARIYSGDSSAGTPTPEQQAYVESLRKNLSAEAPGPDLTPEDIAKQITSGDIFSLEPAQRFTTEEIKADYQSLAAARDGAAGKKAGDGAVSPSSEANPTTEYNEALNKIIEKYGSAVAFAEALQGAGIMKGKGR